SLQTAHFFGLPSVVAPFSSSEGAPLASGSDLFLARICPPVVLHLVAVKEVTQCVFSLSLQFIILVVDSTDRERLAISKEELYRMLAHEDLRKAAVLIFANKQDMKDCMSAAEISKYLTLSSIKDHPWHIQSCCALTGEG
uniref:ADP-ribosylation factor-like 8 n=1 Tax=Fundulus heteroclitus TaxID=8078 RepID=A0A3Q2PKR0_FUNHE